MSLIPNDVETSHYFAVSEVTLWEVLDASRDLLRKAAFALWYSALCSLSAGALSGVIYLIVRIARWLMT